MSGQVPQSGVGRTDGSKLIKAKIGSYILHVWSGYFCDLAYRLWKMSYPCCIATHLFHKLLGQACRYSINTIDNKNHSLMIILTS